MYVKRTTKIFSFILSLIICLPMLGIGSPTVRAIENPLKVEIVLPENLYVDDTVNITFKLRNITTPLTGIEYTFNFDSSILQPVITVNTNDEMNAFMVKTPPKGWEQLCGYDASTSTYSLRFVSLDGGTDLNNLIKTGEDLIVSVPFVVKKAGTCSLKVIDSDVYGIDKSLNTIQGTGSVVSATTKNDLNRFSVALSAPEKVAQGAKTNLTVTLTNNRDTNGIIGLEFTLKYDNKAVTPVITANDADQMNAFLTQTPASAWEQMCSFDSSTSSYTIRIVANNAGSADNEILKTGNSIVLNIPFSVIGEINTTAAFSVPSEGCIGVNSLTKTIYSQGGNTSFTIIEQEKLKPVENGSVKINNSNDKPYIFGLRDNTSIAKMLTGFENKGLVVKDANGNVVTDGICKTGYTVSVYNGSNLVDSATIVIKGDINGDGKVGAADYLFVKRAFIGNLTLNYTQLQAAYITDKPVINANCYLLIKRYVLGTYDIYK